MANIWALHYSNSENHFDPKFGLKLQFAYNQNKVQFAPKCPILHIKFPKMSRDENPNSRRGLEATPSCTYPRARPSSSPQFDPHFQIPSAVYGRRPPPNPLTGGPRGKRALSRCKGPKGGPEKALLAVKGRVGWRNGRITLERAT